MVLLLAFLVTTTGRQFKLLIYSLVLLALLQHTTVKTQYFQFHGDPKRKVLPHSDA